MIKYLFSSLFLCFQVFSFCQEEILIESISSIDEFLTADDIEYLAWYFEVEEDKLNVDHLMVFSLDECDLDMLKIAMENGADPLYKFEGDGAFTAIVLCNSDENVMEMATYFLAAGGNINDVDAENDSTLSYAVSYGEIEIVDFLFRSNVNTDIPLDNYGTHFFFDVETVEILEYLIEKDIDIQKKDINGNTLLHRATEKRRYEIIEKLVSENLIDKTVKNNDGYTTLDIAISLLDQRLIDLLK